MRRIHLAVIGAALLVAPACDLFGEQDCDLGVLSGPVDALIAARVTVTDSQLQPMGGEPVQITFDGYRCGVDDPVAHGEESGTTGVDGDMLTDWWGFQFRNTEDYVAIGYALPDRQIDGTRIVEWGNLDLSSHVEEWTVWLAHE